MSTVDIILLDEQVEKVKESVIKVVEIELCEEQIKDVVYLSDADLILNSLKESPLKTDTETIKNFIDIFGTDAVLEQIEDHDIEDEVNDRILNGDINSEELNDSDNVKSFVTENLEDVELWEAFLNATQRCNPRYLITLLDNAK